MSDGDLLSELRSQSFYLGQILRVRRFPGEPAEGFTIPSFVERVPRIAGGSLPLILETLGQSSVYAAIVGGFERALPDRAGDAEDAILVAPYSAARELFWQLLVLTESLDEARRCLVVSETIADANRIGERLKGTIRRADIEYAVSVVVATSVSDWQGLQHMTAGIVIVTVDSLRQLLHDGRLTESLDSVIASLGRVVLPSVDDWSPALHAHAPFILRELLAEAAMRAYFPSLIATCSPLLNDQDFISALWGKPLDGAAFVRRDSVESPPMTVVNYSGGLVRNPHDDRSWVRQDPEQVAGELLGWLAGKAAGFDVASAVELHYLLDTSGSMASTLAVVAEAIKRDVAAKIANGKLQTDDVLALTVFDQDARPLFREPFTDSARAAFEGVLDAQSASGGTDLPKALAAALEAAIRADAGSVHIVLFSDGDSPLTPETRSRLLNLARKGREQGREIHILYVALDFEPPPAVRNLISELGGEVVTRSRADLERGRSLHDPEAMHRGTVVLLSGEDGLPADATQDLAGGARRVYYSRTGSRIEVDQKDVEAVVVSGRFSSVTEIRNHVKHFGRELLTVFVVTPAEAAAQFVTEDYGEASDVGRAALMASDNRLVARARLLDFVGRRDVEFHHFKYVAQGARYYQTFLEQARVTKTTSSSVVAVQPQAEDVGGEFELVREREEWRIRARGGTIDEFPMQTYSGRPVIVEGQGVKRLIDDCVTPLVCFEGAVVESADAVAEVGSVEAVGTGRRFVLRKRSWDRFVPRISDPQIVPSDPEALERSSRQITQLGELRAGHVRLSGSVHGLRHYPAGNLEDKFVDTAHQDVRFDVESQAVCWSPALSGQVTIGALANLLRLTLPAAFPHHDKSLLVVPDADTNVIWCIDLAPGGNGASSLLASGVMLAGLLELAGKVLLQCPCELGLAGATEGSAAVTTTDAGCPRCTRVIGPVVISAGVDVFSGAPKRAVLNWLMAAGLLPSSASKHIQEKYDGIDDSSRVSGPDRGTRRGCLRLAKRILIDRLGLEIAESDVARFEWLESGVSANALGVYYPTDNKIAIRHGLVEWLMIDVAAHELFHNFQARGAHCGTPLFNYNLLGHSADPKPPFDGKFYVEGSAMWAESHVVDALAVRTSLDLANLRHGDEYGEGFQFMKRIEEDHGGVAGVLAFLESGALPPRSDGVSMSKEQLLREMGVA